MRILFSALELAPLIKVGGVADVVAGLAEALVRRGHAVTAVLPRRREPQGPQPAWLPDLVTLPVTGFERGNPYGHEVDPGGAGAERLAGLAAGVIELIAARARAGAAFDVVHLHDWPVAMVAYVLRTVAPIDPVPRVVLTVHNASVQGLLPVAALPKFGLGPEHEPWMRHQGLVSTLLAGVLAADVVVTVSPTYARELCTAAGGFGLHEAFAARGDELVGIANGIDTRLWDPAHDPALAAAFDATDPSGRVACRTALAAELGVPADDVRPIVLYCARLHAEKGADLVAAALPGLVAAGVRVVVAGAGEPALEEALRAAAVRAGPAAHVVGWASEPLLRRLLSGCDFVLVPSRRESCGMLHQYGQRYGAVPVAHRTGGLADTIADPRDQPEASTGILFDAPTVEAIMDGVQRAVASMRLPAGAALQRRCLGLDRSWDRVVLAYERVYGVA